MDKTILCLKVGPSKPAHSSPPNDRHFATELVWYSSKSI